MNLLNKLTSKSLNLNRKRTIVTIIGIVLSVAMLTALSTLISSFRETAIYYEKTRDGNYHLILGDVSNDEMKSLKANRSIENLSFSSAIGFAKLDGIKNQEKPYLYIKAYDKYSLDNLGFILLEGRMPQNENEIVLSKHLKTNGRVDLKVGDKINLNIGERFLKEDNSLITENDRYLAEEEVFREKEVKEYTVVGIIERPGYSVEDYSAAGYTCLTYFDTFDKTDNYQAYIRFYKQDLKNYQRAVANILNVDVDLFELVNSDEVYSLTEEERIKKYDELAKELDKSDYDFISMHTYLISLEYFNFKDSTMQVLYTVGAVVALIIMVTSIFCIRNSFDISITEKTKQYGMLASIGATKKQIKKNVLYEAFILGIIGIPLGLILGLVGSYVLILVSNYLLTEAVDSSIVFKMSAFAIVGAILLSVLTIYFSAIKSARKASKISPITAIRNNDDIKINSKKIKSPKIIKTLFGIGGDVSYKNLKRNKKKYRTTVISIVVCVSVFIALTSFMNLAFKSVELQFRGVDYNIGIDLKDNDIEKLNNVTEQLLNNTSIKRYNVVKYMNGAIDKPRLTDDCKEYFYDGSELDILPLSIMSVSDESYKEYVKDLNLNYDDVKNKAIIINNEIVYKIENGKEKKLEINILDYKKGDIIKYTTEGKEAKDKKKIDIEVALLTDKTPFGILDQNVIIVSEKYFNEISPDTDERYIYLEVEDADKYQDEADKIVANISDYHVINYNKQLKQQKSIFLLVGLFLYGFITVIALIGITNIFNTITTNMNLRRREFATLKSVGMTNKEFNRMIRLESFFYGMKSLIIGIPLGCILSYLIYKALMGGMIEFAYSIPVNAIIISILAVFILISCIMKYSISKINKQNTIETIRNDNI